MIVLEALAVAIFVITVLIYTYGIGVREGYRRAQIDRLRDRVRAATRDADLIRLELPSDADQTDRCTQDGD